MNGLKPIIAFMILGIIALITKLTILPTLSYWVIFAIFLAPILAITVFMFLVAIYILINKIISTFFKWFITLVILAFLIGSAKAYYDYKYIQDTDKSCVMPIP